MRDLIKKILREDVFGVEPAQFNNFRELLDSAPEDLQKRVMALKVIPQNAIYHPEGNVLKHTITVVNRALKDDDINMAIAALLHDVGKDETLAYKGDRPTAYGHEKVSASMVKNYRDWIISLGGLPSKVFFIIKNHMRVKKFDEMRPKKQEKLKSFGAFDKLKDFSKIDRGGLDV